MVGLLSPFTYYIVPFLWTLYLRRWAFPLFVLLFFGHDRLYGSIVDDATLAEAAFRWWLPLTALASGSMGYVLGGIVNFRRMLFLKNFDSFGCWIPFALLQWILLQSTVLVWEFQGHFVRPLSYFITLLAFIVQIAFWWWWTYDWTIWGFHREGDPNEDLHYDDHASHKFYGFLMLFVTSTTIIFLIFSWATPNLTSYWITLITFGFHAIVTLILVTCVLERPETRTLQEGYKSVRSSIVTASGMDSSVYTSTGAASNNYQMLKKTDESRQV